MDEIEGLDTAIDTAINGKGQSADDGVTIVPAGDKGDEIIDDTQKVNDLDIDKGQQVKADVKPNADTSQNLGKTKQVAQEESVYSKAVENLSKVLGKKLDDTQAKEELAKSHLNSEGFIQQQTEDIKVLVGKISEYETWYNTPSTQAMVKAMQNPKVADIVNKISQGQDPFIVKKEADFLDDITDNDIPNDHPIMQKMSTLEAQLQSFIAEKKNKEQQEFQAQQTERNREFYKKIEEFKKVTPDFANMYDNYLARLKVNKYAMPNEQLTKWTNLVSQGYAADEAWGILNKDFTEKQLREKISQELEAKKKNNSLTSKRVSQGIQQPSNENMTLTEVLNAALDKMQGG